MSNVNYLYTSQLTQTTAEFNSQREELDKLRRNSIYNKGTEF